MRRPRVVAAGATLLAAAVAGSVATIAVRGGSNAPTLAKPPPVTTAEVVRTTLSDSLLTAGTLGYSGAFTVTAPVGTAASALVQAEQAAASAQLKVRADRAALTDATTLEQRSASIASANADLMSARRGLTSARAQLATDEQLGCPPSSSSTTTSGASGGSGAAASSPAPQAALAPHDASIAAPTVSVTTASATTTVATVLSATVDPNGAATSYSFHYGTNPAMSSSTSAATLAAGTSPVDVEAMLDGLTPATTYLVTVVASNAAGTTSAITETFTTATSSCTVERTTVHEEAAAVTAARDALIGAQLAASGAVTTASQQLASDQASAGYAEQVLSTAAAAAANPGSIVTSVAPPNASITRGEPVYALNGHSVPLFYGTAVLSRALDPGTSAGADVAELNANLAALGFGPSLAGATQFSNRDRGGTSPLPGGNGPRRHRSAPPRRRGRRGGADPRHRRRRDAWRVAATGRRRARRHLDGADGHRSAQPDERPHVFVGEAVSIVLPSNATTPGRISAIGPVPPASPSGSTASPSGQGGPAGTTQLTVTPTDPAATGSGASVSVQVSLTTNTAADVLAVPISALLALSGGGYGLEVVAASGRHELVAVTTGLYSNTLVEVRGPAIHVGTRVVVAQ